MKQFLVYTIILCSFYSVQSQDTVYLDNNRTICEKSAAVRYQIITRDKEDTSLVREAIFDMYNMPISETYYQPYHKRTRVGTRKSWYFNGNLKLVAEYADNEYHGTVQTYWMTGEPKRTETYEYGERKTSVIYDEDGNEMDYFPLIQFPEFPGGEKQLFQFLIKNTKYPKKAKKKDISGIVYIQFVVDKDGKLRDEIVLEGVHPLLDEEALRVVRIMPKWKPGKEDGYPVSIFYKLPFRFTL